LFLRGSDTTNIGAKAFCENTPKKLLALQAIHSSISPQNVTAKKQNKDRT